MHQCDQDQLRTIIYSQFLRMAAPAHQSFQHSDHTRSRQTQINLKGQCFAVKFIHNIDCGAPPAMKQLKPDQHWFAAAGTQRLWVASWQMLLTYAPLISVSSYSKRGEPICDSKHVPHDAVS